MCSVCSVVTKIGIEEWVLLDDLPIDRIVHELPCEQSHVGEVFRRPSGTHRIEDGQHVDTLLHNRSRYGG